MPPRDSRWFLAVLALASCYGGAQEFDDPATGLTASDPVEQFDSSTSAEKPDGDGDAEGSEPSEGDPAGPDESSDGAPTDDGCDTDCTTTDGGEPDTSADPDADTSADSEGEEADDDRPWIFVLMGQSNMVGSGGTEGANGLGSLPRVSKLVQSTQPGGEVWSEDLVPLHDVWAPASVGLGNSFAQRLVEYEPDRDIKLVPCGIPGSSIYSYEKGTAIDMNIYGNQFVTGDQNLYEHCVRRAQLAVESGGVIKAVLFHQGETNNGDPEWDDRVIQLIEDFRAEPDIPEDVPFILGELLQEQTSTFDGHNALVGDVADALPRVSRVGSAGLFGTGDGVHFSSTACIDYGHRYFEEWVTYDTP